MSIESWAALIVSIGSIVALVTGGIKWLTKHYFDEIRAEFKPNGGSSLKDQVNRLELEMSHMKDHLMREEKEQADMQRKLDRMYQTIIDFISSNKK
jgi:hypothetical protein